MIGDLAPMSRLVAGNYPDRHVSRPVVWLTPGVVPVGVHRHQVLGRFHPRLGNAPISRPKVYVSVYVSAVSPGTWPPR
jgi:hypothetical protein